MKKEEDLFGDISLFNDSSNKSEENSVEHKNETRSEKNPLAYRMRPTTLSDYVGQEHILGDRGILRLAIERDILSSIIFYGPPGTGKTTLAYLIAKHTKAVFRTLNAVLSGVQQIREEIDLAKSLKKRENRRTILFVDEVHRWNKAQQDALLPHVENGTIILIGATTENPFFEVNKSLLSRSRVFELKPLKDAHLEQILYKAFSDREQGYGKIDVELEDGVAELMIKAAKGDARTLLNTIEFCISFASNEWPIKEGEKIKITMDLLLQVVQKKQILYDKKGDYHYDVISAFIKSVRGGDADAALYYLAIMCEAGEDPHFIFRRLLILAAEDVGLACPVALSVVVSAKDAFDMVGMPEGNYFLSFATLYLATRDKSNSTGGFFSALSYIKTHQFDVPQHLKDASRDSALHHGEGYLYPHNYSGHWVPQQYLPDGALGEKFYVPTEEGDEKAIKEMLEERERMLKKLK